MPKHEYPRGWEPGAHWASDEAWRVLDILMPGHLSLPARELLAGAMTGALIKAYKQGELNILKGNLTR
jgi:hypothetical protein